MQENRKEFDNTEHTLVIEGRNAVLEAFRSGKPIDKVFVLDGCQDGPVRTIVREAKSMIRSSICGKRAAFTDFRDRKTSGCNRICGCL